MRGDRSGSAIGYRDGTDSYLLGEAPAASETKEIFKRAWVEDI